MTDIEGLDQSNGIRNRLEGVVAEVFLFNDKVDKDIVESFGDLLETKPNSKGDFLKSVFTLIKKVVPKNVNQRMGEVIFKKMPLVVEENEDSQNLFGSKATSYPGIEQISVSSKERLGF